ncbi:hypothetical protein ATC00_28670 [Sinorhizobium americanum]|nr:hypothetical protein ATC00_28670 [Sinorhizobium americanum]
MLMNDVKGDAEAFISERIDSMSELLVWTYENRKDRPPATLMKANSREYSKLTRRPSYRRALLVLVIGL